MTKVEFYEGPGRPAEFTEKEGTQFAPVILYKLENAFLKGMNNREACFLANISEPTFYAVCDKSPGLLDRFKMLQEAVKVKAKEVVAEKIEKSDIETSKWYLEKKHKEFKPKVDVTSGDNPIPIMSYAIPSHDGNGQDNSVKDEDKSS